MKTPKFLDDKYQVILFGKEGIINRSTLKIVKETIYIADLQDVYLYFEDYQGEDITLDIAGNADIRIFQILKSTKNNHFSCHYQIHEAAQVECLTAFRNTDKVHVSMTRDFQLDRKAILTLNNALVDMGEIELKDQIHLNGEGAQSEIDLLNIGSYNDQVNVYQDIYHQAKHTASDIHNSLISNLNAKLTYSVSGHIAKGNEYSKCYQSNKGIILGEDGEIEVEPKLFIDEYNVEAGHGAAIGQMDDEQMYYLQSRGLSETEARSLIISGYTRPFIDKIADADIKALIERQIYKKINEVDIK